MVTSTSSEYTSTIFPTFIPTNLDTSLGFVCILCCILGTIGNILALIYFGIASSRKDLPSVIYVIMAVTDLVSSLSLFPAVEAFLAFQRAGNLFKFPWLCYIWGILWGILPYFSVFLVLTLSVVRTRCLMSPFRKINQPLTYSIIVIYFTYLLLRIVMPLILKRTDVFYQKSSVMCISFFTLDVMDNEPYLVTYYLTSNCIQLALPLLPIIASCILSCYSVWKSGRLTSSSRSDVQKQATITIIIITLTYIVFNFPVFIAYLIYILQDVFKVIHVLGDMWSWYGWTYVLLISVCMNAAVNPIIYISRIKKMRWFYRTTIRRRAFIAPRRRNTSFTPTSCAVMTNNTTFKNERGINLTPKSGKIGKKQCINLERKQSGATTITSTMSRNRLTQTSREMLFVGSNGNIDYLSSEF